MRVAFSHSLAASKKEPLAEMLDRVRQAFLDVGLGEPAIRFTLVGEGRKEGASPLDRILKHHPEMERFVTFTALIPNTAESRLISNAESGEPAEYATLQAIAAGVPRSYPLNGVMVHFHAPLFGERLIGLPRFGHSLPGVMVTDTKWVTGRNRAVSIYTVVDAEMGDKKLPPNPAAVDALIKACGKVRRTDQVPIRAPGGAPGQLVGSIPSENVEAVKVIVADYRARISEIVALADMPHDLPPAADIRMQNVGVTAGPLKPALEAAFKPMDYSCRGGSGQFHLTRRTQGNLTVELYLDVGTWSHSVTAIFLVQGAGFKASLVIPVSPRNPGSQYPIGDAAQWQRIVENLAAMVRALDRSFTPEVEQAAGPSPAWYHPSA